MLAKLVLVGVAVGFFAGEDPATITVEDFPVRGIETDVELSNSPEATHLRVTYQPDAPVAVSEDFVLGDDTSIRWTPRNAGIAKLESIKIQAPREGEGEEDAITVFASQDVSVKFDGIPASGVVIALFAALVLFGGAFFSMKALLTAGGSTED